MNGDEEGAVPSGADDVSGPWQSDGHLSNTPGGALMPKNPIADEPAEEDEAARADVEEETDKLRHFVSSLTADDVKSGNWFEKLLAQSLKTYTDKVDAEYFQKKYRGVPADGIVDRRIKTAANYAAIEGGLSASAYTATVAATIGSLGGASPLTVPAAVTSVLVDVAFLTQLQIRLAWDVSVLYGIRLDPTDPEDLWKLIRVAFTIKGGEVVREGVLKAAPALIRPFVKRFYSGPALAAAKGLPVVGKHLLQRNVIKIAIPAVGVPLAVGLNHWTTVLAGRHAQAVFRNEARVIEIATGLARRTRHPQLMLWTAWLVITADKKVSDDEVLLMRHLVALARETHEVVDERLARVVDMDPDDVWERMASEEGDLSDVLDAAQRVAAVDGEASAAENAVLAEIARRADRS
jgi:tellurite resistance protein